ncbi:MAG: hypothetical protein J7501_02770, partial [Bdellovibrio sp.]|nr:hypothetical protein [Bdellovibrio sp.]
GLSYSWISWSSPLTGGEIYGFNGNLTGSVGFYNYISERLLFKLFARVVSEDKNIWNGALDASQGFDIPVEAVVNTMAGVSLGYVF